MKKDTIRFLIIGAVVLVAYHFAIFMIPCYKTPTFWVSWVFTLVAFGVSGFGIYKEFVNKNDAKSRFYGFPILKIAFLYLVAQVALGGIFMALGHILPWWSAAVTFAIGLALAVIGLISAETVVEEIHAQDAKLKKDVSLMRGLQSKVNQMAAQCDNPDAAADVKRFAEEMRYCDPVSSEALADIEADLTAAVDELQSAIVDGDSASTKQLCRKASAVLAERNRLCKLNKG